MNAPKGEAVRSIMKLRLITAIKTPYRMDGNIDYPAFDKHCEHQVECGVEGLVIGGTTGEGHLLSWDEHLALIAHSKARFGDKLAIIGNTGSNHTAESVWATRKGFAAGMDASLLINPYYGKTSKRGVIMHIQEGMKYGPAIIYNVAGRTGQDIPPETIYELAEHENFCGVKECSGKDRIKELSDNGIVCWSGNDDECYESRLLYGATGVISVTSNIVPSLFRELMHGKKDDKNDALNAKLGPLYGWLFKEPNPIGVNTMMMQLGMCKPVFRMPYTYRSKEFREDVAKLLQGLSAEKLFSMPISDVKVLEDADFTHVLGD